MGIDFIDSFELAVTYTMFSNVQKDRDVEHWNAVKSVVVDFISSYGNNVDNWNNETRDSFITEVNKVKQQFGY